MNETTQTFDSDKFTKAIGAYQQADNLIDMKNALKELTAMSQLEVDRLKRLQEQGIKDTPEANKIYQRDCFWKKVASHIEAGILPTAPTRSIVCAAGNTIEIFFDYLPDLAESRCSSTPSFFGLIIESNSNSDGQGDYWDMILNLFTGNVEWTECTDLFLDPKNKAYRCSWAGSTNEIFLKDIDDSRNVVVGRTLATGEMKVTLVGEEYRHTDTVVAITGLENGMEMIYTFRPGDPIRPDALAKEVGPDMIDQTITVAEAKALGFTVGLAAPAETN